MTFFDFSKIEAKKLILADEEFEMTHVFEKLSDLVLDIQLI